MKHLPCIPDDVVSAEDRQFCYTVENYHVRQPVVFALLAILDALAAAYLDLARERDKYKGVCELAKDDEFWKALKLLEM